ncbi:MAG: Ricin and poly(3-hydroxybutyrate) depolymerase fusion [Deltaproteobacteria bacterium]|nr:Ricin and poly(3-hydroxybutyrate) depolymerase fusion [Deltaproteobacteria bacterium]
MRNTLLVALALVVGCGGSSPSSDTDAAAQDGDAAPGDGAVGAVDASPGAPDAGATQTAGCGMSGGAPGLQTKTLTVANVARTYRVFVPTGYDSSTPTRLVFVFHGLGGDGNQIRAYFGFEAQAGGQALFVYPDGLVVQGGQTGWAASDLAFFDAMVTEISAHYCVDPQRIFAAGHSFGGYMSNLVGCSRGTVVRAIAPVSGGLAGGACDHPVAAWIAHGDNDQTVNQSEGIAARDRWRMENGCATTSTATDPTPCVTYDGCSAGHPVTWCSFSGGHYPLPAFIKPGIWNFLAQF